MAEPGLTRFEKLLSTTERVCPMDWPNEMNAVSELFPDMLPWKKVTFLTVILPTASSI